MHSTYIDELCGAEVYFKCEQFQKVGAFKYRGASHAIHTLSDEQRAKGICTHSSGNHAQAVAKVCQESKIAATIVMPRTAPKVKVAAVEGYGATVIFCEPTLDARESTLAAFVKKSGATIVHPFANEQVILGQATCAQEIIEDLPRLDILMSPVGGGGLLSGSILSCHYFSPETKVFAAEPENVNDAFLSMAAGKIIPNKTTQSVADGLLTTIGDINFEIMRSGLHEVLLVSEAEIIAAMRIMWERLKIVTEPSAAAPLAAVLKNRAAFQDKKVCLIVTGGNVDLQKVGEWYAST